MNLTWHVPNFVDADEEEPVEFNSAEEFYAIPHIVELSEQADFLRWSISNELLMVECKDESFWVIASFNRATKEFMKGILPKWEMPLRKQVELINHQLPTCIMDRETGIVGKQIAEARVVGEGMEFRFEGETDWTLVPRDTGLAYGYYKNWESTNRLLLDPSPAYEAVTIYRKVNGVMQEVSREVRR